MPILFFKIFKNISDKSYMVTTVLEIPGKSWKVLEDPGISLYFKKLSLNVLDFSNISLKDFFFCGKVFISSYFYNPALISIERGFWLIYDLKGKFVAKISKNCLEIPLYFKLSFWFFAFLSWKKLKNILENPGKSLNLELQIVWSPWKGCLYLSRIEHLTSYKVRRKKITNFNLAFL